MSFRSGRPTCAVWDLITPPCIHYIWIRVWLWNEWDPVFFPAASIFTQHSSFSPFVFLCVRVFVITKLTSLSLFFFFTQNKILCWAFSVSLSTSSLSFWPVLFCVSFHICLFVRLPPLSASTWADRSPRRRASRELRNWMSCSLKPAQRLATMSNR